MKLRILSCARVKTDPDKETRVLQLDGLEEGVIFV